MPAPPRSSIKASVGAFDEADAAISVSQVFVIKAVADLNEMVAEVGMA